MLIRGLVLLEAILFACPALGAEPTPRVPDGFKCELILAAPDIKQPTALCTAPHGDVYLADAGRIWLLKGGDPKKQALFAENIGNISGLELVREKLYVVHAPFVTVFTLDSDSKAKERLALFTDAGPAIRGIRMGMDGWLYVSVGGAGIAKMSRKERDQGSVHVAEGRERRSKERNHISLEGGGVIRFRPDGFKLEVFASGLCNPWDLSLDEQDRVFVCDSYDYLPDRWTGGLVHVVNGGFYGYPWAFKRRPLETLPIMDPTFADVSGGWIYTDDCRGERYRGHIFFGREKTEDGEHYGTVSSVKVVPDGASFKCVLALDTMFFMDSRGTSVKVFTPVSLRPTADGRAFYLIDSGYRSGIPFGRVEVDKGARLWKVTYTRNDVKPQPRGKDTDSVDDLIKSLGHPAHSERLRAQRALIAKGLAANDPLLQQLQYKKLSPAASRHALWVLRETDAPEWIHAALLESRTEDDSVIYNAIRVLGTFDQAAVDPKQAFLIAGELITILDNDDNQANRHQAAIALERVATQKWCRDLVWEGEKQTDPFVKFASARTLKRTADWSVLSKTLPLDNFDKWQEGSREVLFMALTDELDLGAVAILQRILDRPEPAFRKRARELLSRVQFDRKPYTGTPSGPLSAQPPARDVEWAGTPLVRAAIEKAKKE